MKAIIKKFFNQSKRKKIFLSLSLFALIAFGTVISSGGAVFYLWIQKQTNKQRMITFLENLTPKKFPYLTYLPYLKNKDFQNFDLEEIENKYEMMNFVNASSEIKKRFLKQLAKDEIEVIYRFFRKEMKNLQTLAQKILSSPQFNSAKEIWSILEKLINNENFQTKLKKILTKIEKDKNNEWLQKDLQNDVKILFAQYFDSLSPQDSPEEITTKLKEYYHLTMLGSKKFGWTVNKQNFLGNFVVKMFRNHNLINKEKNLVQGLTNLKKLIN